MSEKNFETETLKIVSELIGLYIEVEHPRILSYVSRLETLLNNHIDERLVNCDSVVQKFGDFKEKMIEHIEIEEHIIFPKIIRICKMNFLELNSIAGVFYEKQLMEWLSFHKLVNEYLDSITDMSNEIHNCDINELSDGLFDEFSDYLLKHAASEDDILYPFAVKLLIENKT